MSATVIDTHSTMLQSELDQTTSAHEDTFRKHALMQDVHAR